MIECYRIEHPSDNLGICTIRGISYQNKEFDYNPLVMFPRVSQYHSTLPTPQAEGIELDKDEYCGFTTLTNLKKFCCGNSLEKYVELGFKVYIIRLITGQVGKTQVGFKNHNVLSRLDVTQMVLNT